ncbi:MAG TPA: sugar transferase, partial [Opitutaceae bacterium]
MNALLLCPAYRPAVSRLAEHTPLVTTPLLGRTLVEYWMDALAARGVKRVLLLASDRPQDVRTVVGEGTRWGIHIDVLPQSRELSLDEARAKYATSAEFAPENVMLLQTLPGLPEQPLFESYAGWHQALTSYFKLAITPTRIGMHEVQPGVWVGLHAQIAPTAQLHAPCWIGEGALIGAHAVVGPKAVVENHAIVEEGARAVESIIGPETFVGEMISVQHSIAQGSMLINWQTDSCLHVPDAFFLCSLSERDFATSRGSVAGRLLAGFAMIATSPFAAIVMLLSLLRGESPMQLRLGVRPQRNIRSAALQTFAYYELSSGSNWLKRWPQFWSVVRGDLAWVGNRPLRPTQALELANDFERLWLAAPVGLVSLADAHGCTEALNDEICAHASFYAVNASRRLDAFILSRALVRALFAIPI